MCDASRRVMRLCSSVGVVVLVVSACCMLLATLCFQLLPPDSPLLSGAKRGAECVSLLSRYIASPLSRSRTRLPVAHMETGPRLSCTGSRSGNGPQRRGMKAHR